eukprot:scaffold29959_cov36-Phaeocystis_antarctica.AAC.1
MSRAHRAHQIANFSAAQDEDPLQSGPPAEAQSEPELRRREVLYYYWTTRRGPERARTPTTGVLTAYYHLPLLPHQACSHKALGGEALVKKNNQRLAAHEAAADALVAEGAPDRTMWASASGRAMEASAGGRAMEEEFE